MSRVESNIRVAMIIIGKVMPDTYRQHITSGRSQRKGLDDISHSFSRICQCLVCDHESLGVML